MKTMLPNLRAPALLIPVVACLTAPAFGQDVPTPIAPPPVVATLPTPTPTATPSAEADRPVESTTTAPGSRTTLSPEAQAALDEARQRRAARPARSPQPVPTAASRPLAPPTASSAPVTNEPAAALPSPAPVIAAPLDAPVPAPTAAAATPEPAAEQGTRLWPLLAVLGLAALAAVALLARRRRRAADEAVWADDDPIEHTPVAAPEPAVAPRPPEPRPAPAAPVYASSVTAGRGFQVTAPVIRPRGPTARAPVTRKDQSRDQSG